MSNDIRAPSESAGAAQTIPATKPTPARTVANGQVMTSCAIDSTAVNAPAGHAALATSAWFVSRQPTRQRIAHNAASQAQILFPSPIREGEKEGQHSLCRLG